MQQLPSSETMQIRQENDIFAVLKGKKKKVNTGFSIP